MSVKRLYRQPTSFFKIIIKLKFTFFICAIALLSYQEASWEGGLSGEFTAVVSLAEGWLRNKDCAVTSHFLY